MPTPTIRFSKTFANPDSPNTLLQKIGLDLSGIYHIPCNLPGEPERTVPFAELTSQETGMFYIKMYCGGITVYHTFYSTIKNDERLELTVIYHNSGKAEPARTLGKAKVALSSAETWLTNTLMRGFELFEIDDENISASELERSLVNPIYAITEMVPRETVVKAQAIMIRQKGAEAFLEAMIDSVKSMFDYDETEGVIRLQIQLDQRGKSLWSKYARERS